MWARIFGSGAQIASGDAVAIDGSGNVFVGGDFQLPLDLGNGALGNPGAYVGKLDGNGAAVWSKAFGGAGSISTVDFLAADASGAVIIAGSFTGSINCGGATLTSRANDTNTLFVAKLDGGGHHVWSKSFGDGTNQVSLGSLSLSGDTGLVLAGTYDQTIAFGGAALTPPGGASSGDFVVQLDAASGNQVWGKSLPATTSIYAAVDSAGNVVLTGAFSGSVNLGGGALASAGGLDVLVARLDPSGNHLWSKRFGGATDDDVNVIAADPSGAIYLGGLAGGSIDFGGGALAANAPYVVQLGSGGAHAWSKSMTGTVRLEGMVADGGSGVLLSGSASGAVQVGSAQIPKTGSGFELMALKMDTGGNVVSSRRAGNGAGVSANQIAVNASHAAAVVATSRGGTMNLGTGALTCTGVCAMATRLSM